MFYREEKNGVVIYKSTMLRGVRHGFGTRIGGVSTGATSSLNLGYDRGDAEGTVNENRRRLAAACGVGEEHFVGDSVFVSAKQIHSARIEYVTPSTAGGEFACDGFVTDTAGVPIAVKMADCVPILLYEGGAGVAAAVHAGWRGTASGIAAIAVERMCRLGAKRSRIMAAIGPSICGNCFVVGEDFEEQFRALAAASPHSRVRAGSAEIAGEFITRGEDGRLRCDLQSVNERMLAAAGVVTVDVAGGDVCTYEHRDEFYSHRRDGAARGVMAAVIML